MATGFGVNPSLVNGVLTGTTSQDIRKIVEGMYYHQGILRGCKVKTTAGLNYQVELGAVVCEFSQGESVLVPVYATTVATTAPGASDRQDYIVVRQNMPNAQGEGSSSVVVEVVHTKPATYSNTVVLAQYTAKAGKTRTDEFVEASGFYRTYAIPTGTAGKYLFQGVDKNNTAIKPKKDLPWMQGNFTLETDRMIEIGVGATVDCAVSDGIPDALYAIVWIDNIRIVTFSSGKIDDSWSTSNYWVHNMSLEAGTHTIKIHFEETGNTGKLWTRYSANGGFGGCYVTVKDLGVLE